MPIKTRRRYRKRELQALRVSETAQSSQEEDRRRVTECDTCTCARRAALSFFFSLFFFFFFFRRRVHAWCAGATVLYSCLLVRLLCVCLTCVCHVCVCHVCASRVCVCRCDSLEGRLGASGGSLAQRSLLRAACGGSRGQAQDTCCKRCERPGVGAERGARGGIVRRALIDVEPDSTGGAGE